MTEYKSAGRRGAAWRKLRLQVLARDGRVCQLCHHVIADDQPGEVDHIEPRAQGGSNRSIDNFRAAHGSSSPCFECTPVGRCCNQERRRRKRAPSSADLRIVVDPRTL